MYNRFSPPNLKGELNKGKMKCKKVVVNLQLWRVFVKVSKNVDYAIIQELYLSC